MRQIYYVFAAFLVLGLAWSGLAWAQDNAIPENLQVVSVHEARALPDKDPVVVQGYIVKGLGSHKYMLEDESGSIRVKIDKDVWGGKPTEDKDLIMVYGQIHRKGNIVEIEAEKVLRK